MGCCLSTSSNEQESDDRKPLVISSPRASFEAPKVASNFTKKNVINNIKPVQVPASNLAKTNWNNHVKPVIVPAPVVGVPVKYRYSVIGVKEEDNEKRLVIATNMPEKDREDSNEVLLSCGGYVSIISFIPFF
jgi:hypothetical protein